MIKSGYPFEETLTRLKDAIAAENLWLIYEIDPQMLLRKAGYTIRSARQLLYFHPRFMARLLDIDQTAVVEAPLKIVVLEQPDGSVGILAPDPTETLGRYAGLEELAADLAACRERILQSVSPSVLS